MDPWKGIKHAWWPKDLTQTYGVNYLETFALVAKLNTIKLLLLIVANLDWALQ